MQYTPNSFIQLTHALSLSLPTTTSSYPAAGVQQERAVIAHCQSSLSHSLSLISRVPAVIAWQQERAVILHVTIVHLYVPLARLCKQGIAVRDDLRPRRAPKRLLIPLAFEQVERVSLLRQLKARSAHCKPQTQAICQNEMSLLMAG